MYYYLNARFQGQGVKQMLRLTYIEPHAKANKLELKLHKNAQQDKPPEQLQSQQNNQ